MIVEADAWSASDKLKRSSWRLGYMNSPKKPLKYSHIDTENQTVLTTHEDDWAVSPAWITSWPEEYGCFLFSMQQYLLPISSGSSIKHPSDSLPTKCIHWTEEANGWDNQAVVPGYGCRKDVVVWLRVTGPRRADSRLRRKKRGDSEDSGIYPIAQSNIQRVEYSCHISRHTSRSDRHEHRIDLCCHTWWHWNTR